MINQYALCVMILLLSACVSSKKYQRLSIQYQNLSQRLTTDTLRLNQKNTQLINNRDSLLAKHNQLENNYLQLKNDSTVLARNYRRNKILLDELFDKYDQLDKSYKQLSTSISSDALTLTQNVSQKEKDLLILEQKILAQQSKNEKLSVQLEEREIQLLAFENSIQKMNKNASDLKVRLEKALAPLKDTTVKIDQRLGKVIIRIPALNTNESLTEPDILILKKVAGIYKHLPDYTFTINSIVPILPSIPLSESPYSRRPYLIASFLSKEGVTSNKIIVTFRYDIQSSSNPKKNSLQAFNATIEIIAEPKMDAIPQNLLTN